MPSERLRDINIFGWQESPAIPGGYRYHVMCNYCSKYCGHIIDLIFDDQDDIASTTLQVIKEAHKAIIDRCVPVDNFVFYTEPLSVKPKRLDTKHHIMHFQCPKCHEEMNVDIESTDPSTIFDKDFALTISFNEEGNNNDT